MSASDLAALGEFCAGLSARTRFERFFAPVVPTRTMLRRLSGVAGVDGTDGAGSGGRDADRRGADGGDADGRGADGRGADGRGANGGGADGRRTDGRRTDGSDGSDSLDGNGGASGSRAEGHGGPGRPGGIDALVALAGGAIVGHAMAAGLPGPLGTWQADIGVVVADAWQGRGVGSALTNALITRARCRGVSCLSMDVLPGNSRVLAMIASRWPTARIHQGTDFITICARLTAATGNSPAPTLGPRGQAA